MILLTDLEELHISNISLFGMEKMTLELDSSDIQKIIADYFSVAIDDVLVDTEKERIGYGLAESAQSFAVAYISNIKIEDMKKTDNLG